MSSTQSGHHLSQFDDDMQFGKNLPHCGILGPGQGYDLPQCGGRLPQLGRNLPQCGGRLPQLGRNLPRVVRLAG